MRAESCHDHHDGDVAEGESQNAMQGGQDQVEAYAVGEGIGFPADPFKGARSGRTNLTRRKGSRSKVDATGVAVFLLTMSGMDPLMVRIQDGITSGRLPKADCVVTWYGEGRGQHCTACDQR